MKTDREYMIEKLIPMIPYFLLFSILMVLRHFFVLNWWHLVIIFTLFFIGLKVSNKKQDNKKNNFLWEIIKYALYITAFIFIMRFLGAFGWVGLLIWFIYYCWKRKLWKAYLQGLDDIETQLFGKPIDQHKKGEKIQWRKRG